MEAKIMDVLRRMQLILDEVQLRELKEVLQMTFTGCRCQISRLMYADTPIVRIWQNRE